MSEQQKEYVTDAIDMLGKGYPSVEIEHASTVIQRKASKLESIDRPAFIKLYTNFKDELADISGDALKVWVFIVLSINRNSGKANPGLRTIAQKVKLAVNTVQKCLQELEDLHLLTVDRETKRYNIYEAPEYVSANRADLNVSNGDTPAQSVSKSLQSVSNLDDGLQNPLASVILNQNNQNNHTAGVLTSKEVQQVNDKVDAILAAELKPLSIREAMKSFPFNVKWDSKQAREFMEWVNADRITPQQITRAAEIWRSDKQFNWQVPTLSLVFEKWPALMQAVNDDDNKLSNSQRKEGVSSGYFA